MCTTINYIYYIIRYYKKRYLKHGLQFNYGTCCGKGIKEKTIKFEKEVVLPVSTKEMDKPIIRTMSYCKYNMIIILYYLYNHSGDCCSGDIS